MFYIFLIKKNKGDVAPFALSKIINGYTTMFNNDLVISLPGYMSTNRKTTTEFRKKLKLTKNVYFTTGMNGGSALSDDKSVTIQDEHNYQYCSRIGKKISGKDHSKILFFLDYKNYVKKDIKVKAILIGSSNQSYESYFNTPAKKGEADVFIVDGQTIDEDDEKAEKRLRSIYEELDDNSKKSVILTKEISEGNPEYLNEIFAKVLSE